MRRYATLHIRPARRSLRLVAALGLVTALLLPAAAAPAAAAEEGTMTARALVGGHVGVGAWSAVEVDLANDGPAISGELRLGGGQPGASTYGALVDLPTNSKKRYLLYAQPSIFGRDILIDLIAGGQRLATTKVPITAHDVYQPIVVVVAEQPGRLIPDLTAAVSNPNMPVAAIVSLSPADLPGRIEAWSAIDRLVWQDVDSSKLDDAQLDALRAWLGLGGRLVILGGSTGATTLGGFPDAILPFRPTRTVDATPDDLGPLLGAVPALGERLPVLGGTLIEGSVLARSGDDIIAAERSVGQGDVLIVGVDPGQSGIAGSAGARSLWRRAVPMTPGAVVNPLALPDDSAIIAALNYLPAVGLPPVEQLLVLLVAYIVLIGPVNYLVLRRLDRREWAWLTMPLLIVVFSAGAFGLGRLLKGSDTGVNEIDRVRGTVTNDSDEKIEAAAVVFGGSLVRLGDLAPGQTVSVDLALGTSNVFGLPLSERLFGSQSGGGDTASRITLTRRTVIDQLTAYTGKFSTLVGTIGGDGAMLVGWRTATTLAVDVGDEKAAQVGEALYLLPMDVRIGGRTIFPDELIRHTVTRADAGEAFDQGSAFSLSHGSMTVEFAPIAFSGELRATSLTLGMTQGDPSFVPRTKGDPVPPLPDARRRALRRHPRLPALRPHDRALDGVRAPGPERRGQGGRAGALPRHGRPIPRPVRQPRHRGPGQHLLHTLGRHGGHHPVSLAVRTEGLVKRYDGTLAVAGVDLEVAAGEIHGLVGPNGAGKTTTLKMLATLLLPTAGRAEVAGADVVREPDAVRRVIGYMPDSFGVYDDMKVWEYLDFFARCYGLPPARRRQMIGDLLELVDLADKREAPVQALSRGMQQRL